MLLLFSALGEVLGESNYTSGQVQQGKVTFLQAVMELPRPPLKNPLAMPSWAADTSYISGDSKLLLVPKTQKRTHSGETTPYSEENRHDVL